MTIEPPFNRDAARTVDNYVARSNKLDAIAEVTALPRIAHDGVEPRSTPQGSAVSWALWSAREHHLDGDETLALVGLAQHAAAALFSGDGYLYTSAEDLGRLLHWPLQLVRKVMETKGNVWPLVEDRPSNAANSNDVYGWRIPEEALDGNWLDRAARRAHYGKATDEVRR